MTQSQDDLPPAEGFPTCLKCGQTSGNSWEQCGGDCPMITSPYFMGLPHPDGGYVGHTSWACRGLEAAGYRYNPHNQSYRNRSALSITYLPTVRLTKRNEGV